VSKISINIKLFSESKSLFLLDQIKEDVPSVNISIFSSSEDISSSRNIHLVIVDCKSLTEEIISEISKYPDRKKSKYVFFSLSQKPEFYTNIARLGFNNLFRLPDDQTEFSGHLAREVSSRAHRIKRRLNPQNKANYFFSLALGLSRESEEQIRIAKKVAHNPDVQVMIIGETGTGKQLLAKAIHEYAAGENDRFYEVNLNESIGIDEDELPLSDEYETEVVEKSPDSIFEQNLQGTLYIDELADLSDDFQRRLLRLIDAKYDKPESERKKLRIITASAHDSKELINNLNFRKDLYFRLNTVVIGIKPLRERKIDIIPLTEHFFSEFCRREKKAIRRIEEEVLKFLENYPWPGNLRELRNSVELAALLAEHDRLKMTYFENLANKYKIIQARQEYGESIPEDVMRLDLKYLITNMEELNRIYARRIVDMVEGNKSKAALLLEISRPTLNRLLQE
jgi:DNA-binding NtrC family response regulator